MPQSVAANGLVFNPLCSMFSILPKYIVVFCIDTGPKFTFLILTMAEFICLKKEITWDFGLLPCILTYPDMYFVYLQLR